jgi:hypothetical protein
MKFEADRARLEDFRKKWGVGKMWLFGSVLGPDFRQDSDVDVVADFGGAGFGANEPGLLELSTMRAELSAALGWPADLTTLGSLRADPNRRRSSAILRGMKPLV